MWPACRALPTWRPAGAGKRSRILRCWRRQKGSNIWQHTCSKTLRNCMAASTKRDLVTAAAKARLSAVAPYSKFKVGAALLTDDGEIVTGINVESASYGLT